MSGSRRGRPPRTVATGFPRRRGPAGALPDAVPVPAPDRRRLPPVRRYWLWFLALLFAAGLFFAVPTTRGPTGGGSVRLTYTQFLSDVDAGQVRTVTIRTPGASTGALRDGRTYTTVIPAGAPEPQLRRRLAAERVSVLPPRAAAGPSTRAQVLDGLLVLALFVLVVWCWRRLDRGAGHRAAADRAREAGDATPAPGASEQGADRAPGPSGAGPPGRKAGSGGAPPDGEPAPQDPRGSDDGERR